MTALGETEELIHLGRNGQGCHQKILVCVKTRHHYHPQSGKKQKHKWKNVTL